MSGERKGLYWQAAVTAAAALWFFGLANRGINMADEGVQVMYGWLVANGQVTYRDYFVPVAPLGFIIQAVIIKIFGFHLIAGRIYAALQGVAIVLAALRIGGRRLEFPFSLVPAVLLIPYSVSLGSFPHYNVDAAFFLFMGLMVLDGWMDRPGSARAFLFGMFFALAVASKHSTVAVALPVAALAFLVAPGKGDGRKTGRDMITASLGFILPLSLLFIRFAAAHALTEAWSCLTGVGGMKKMLYYHVLPPALAALFGSLVLVRLVVFAGRKWPAAAAPLWGALLAGAALVVYLVPPEMSGPLVLGAVALSLILFVKPDEEYWQWSVIRAFGLLFFLATAITGFDLAHLLMASAAAVLPAGLLVRNVITKSGKGLRAVMSAGLILAVAAGIWLDLDLPHLRHTQGPRWQATAPVRVEGLELMRASPQRADEIELAVRWIDTNTEPDETIFVYPWDLLLYPLADRMPATYDTFLYFEIFDPKIARRVVSDLENTKPPVAIIREEDGKIKHVALTGEAGLITGYIENNYETAVRFGDYRIMTRKRGER